MEVESIMEQIASLEKQSITDADIEAYLSSKELSFSGTGNNLKYSHVFKLFFTEGAKAVLNGEIKHIEI